MLKKLFLTLTGLLFFCAGNVFAQTQPQDNYYQNINPESDANSYQEYQQLYMNNNSLDGYRNSQYRGVMPKRIEPEQKYEQPRVYVEFGIRGISVMDSALKDNNFQDHDNNVSTPEVSFYNSEENIAFSNGVGGALKLGFDKYKNRYEFEISYEKSSADEWSFKSPNSTPTALSRLKFKDSTLGVFNINFNYYRDLFTYRFISPYVGIGAGLSAAKFKFGEPDDKKYDIKSEDKFQKVGNYQLSLGTLLKINDRNKINLSYHYRSLFKDLEIGVIENNVKASEPIEMGYKAHIGELSYQFLF